MCARARARSVMSDPLQPHGLWPGRLVCPWDFPGKNTAVGSHFLLQGIFPTQGSNPRLWGLLNWRVDSSPLHHLGSLWVVYAYVFVNVYLYVLCVCYVCSCCSCICECVAYFWMCVCMYLWMWKHLVGGAFWDAGGNSS